MNSIIYLLQCQIAVESQRQRNWKKGQPKDVDLYFRCETWGPE